MRRRYDLRQIPVSVLFLAAVVGILYYLIRPDLRQVLNDPVGVLIRAGVLVPVALFFAVLATLILWYLFRIFLPGVIRYRRLRILRYRRAIRRQDG